MDAPLPGGAADKPMETESERVGSGPGEVYLPGSLQAERILEALRRISRATALHNKKLVARFDLTLPQAVSLRRLFTGGPMTAGELARQVSLSQATMTGVVDRLEARGLVQRDRNDWDRRRVQISLTAQGRETALGVPIPLQERFATKLATLSSGQQADIARVLADIVIMMEAEDQT